MKTYPLLKNGVLIAFEVDNLLISKCLIANYLLKQPGIANLRKRKLEHPDLRLEFAFRGVQYRVSEDFGDNSRYWVGPKDVRHLPQTEELEKLFLDFKIPLYLKVLVALFLGWVGWMIIKIIYLKCMG